MSDAPAAWVVDASVGVRLALPEPLSDVALRFVGAQAAGGGRLYTPDLFFLECANVLWKAVRRLRIAPAVATQGLADLLALGLHAIPSEALATRALEIALAEGASAYDAAYLAAADQLGCPLLTADEKLLRRARRRHDVRALASLAGSAGAS